MSGAACDARALRGRLQRNRVRGGQAICREDEGRRAEASNRAVRVRGPRDALSRHRVRLRMGGEARVAAMNFELSIINGRTVSDVIRAHRGECIDVVRETYLAHARGESVNPDSYFLRFPEKPDCRIIALSAYWPTGRSRRARSLGIVGTGFIARYVYDFLVDTGWEIEEVRLYDTAPAESEKFRRAACRVEQHRSVTVTSDVTALLTASDLIVFTTVASAPHIADATLFAHNPLVLHISLRDLVPEILLRSQNVVDDIEHVMKANTSPHLTEQRTGNRDFVTGALADVILGRRSVDRSRPIIFSPFGMGILDVAVGKWVYDQAVAGGHDLRLSDFFYETVR